MRLCLFIIFFLPLSLCSYATDNLTYAIHDKMPLPENCFVQGFTFHQEYFYLSCGLYGQSRLLKINREGDIHLEKHLKKDMFAEGLTIANGRLYVLSWKQHTLLQYHLDDFSLIRSQKINAIKEGWGLAFDEQNQTLLISDGSNQLHTVAVSDIDKHRIRKVDNINGEEVTKINELEKVGNLLFANIWKQSHILLWPIDASVPALAKLDFSDDIPFWYRFSNTKVLNGIAYDKARDCLWVTGKEWRHAYALAVNLPRKLKTLAGTEINCQQRIK